MPDPVRTPPEPPRWPAVFLRRADQAAAAAVLALCLAGLAGHWLYQGHLRGRRIEIDRAEPIAIDLKIDINAADWPELCLMPGIGEQLAKRIVEHRQQNGPFHDLQELRQVRGIGPKTLDGMLPYLLPLPDLETTAAGENSGFEVGGTVN
jgi:competence ComEA-like helix-hairpin-helix protein